MYINRPVNDLHINVLFYHLHIDNQTIRQSALKKTLHQLHTLRPLDFYTSCIQTDK